MAYTFRARCFGSPEHIHMVGLGENYPLGVLARHLVEAADHLVVEPHQITQFVVILIPVGNRLAGHA
ncbi:hypothetical protein SDC9_211055 [bioreactor metagenome]|uniref:Uncharacterized protein n=1 Tax=bioreactor metagenome TaxID=1076179 RepID=A0A645JIX4_9ZZZZ